LIVTNAIFESVAHVLRVPARQDPRGNLYPVEFSDLPFRPQRAFVVHAAEAGIRRGGHAHKRCQQLMMSLVGAVEVELGYRGETRRLRLDEPALALFIAPMVWARQTFLTPDAQLLVFASEPYDADDYVTAEDMV
jgi:hypothetical protein